VKPSRTGEKGIVRCGHRWLYTNVGKSTLMNLITKDKDILAENKLFATVDLSKKKWFLKCSFPAF